MSDFTNAKKAVLDLRYKLEKTVRALDEMEYSTAPSKLSDDEVMEYGILRSIQDRLTNVQRDIKYLNSPIDAEGTLYKNDAGRYEIDESHYFTSGAPIEIYIYDEDDERNMWFNSRVEHNGDDYYVVGYKGSIDRLKARIRS